MLKPLVREEAKIRAMERGIASDAEREALKHRRGMRELFPEHWSISTAAELDVVYKRLCAALHLEENYG